MHALVRAIDRFTTRCGRALAWLTLLLVLVTVTVVAIRYLLGAGSIALQESAAYLHSSIFLLGAAYTLKRGGHVRVDIFYRRLSERGRAWVDALGTLVFLLPLCAYIAASSWGYVSASWRIGEGSSDGGLPFIYLLKSLLPAMALLLALQGLAELLRCGLLLAGPTEDDHAS